MVKELANNLKKFDEYPRSFKKMVRYIRQEATLEQIRAMESLFVKTIENRLHNLQKTNRNPDSIS
jgi:hypothetical protein